MNAFKKAILSIFLGNLTVSMGTIIFSLFIANQISPEKFGEFSYLMVFATILAVIIKCGLDNSLIYFHLDGGNKFNLISFGFIFCAGALSLLVLFALEVGDAIKIVMMAVLFAYKDITFAIYRCRNKTLTYYIHYILIISLLQFIFVFFGLLEPFDTQIVCFSIFIIILFPNLLDKTNRVFDGDFIKYGLFSMFAAISGILLNKIDVLMIRAAGSFEDVALYQLSAQISNLLAFVLGTFNLVFAPIIVKLYKQGDLSGLSKLYIKSTRILTAITLLLMILIIFFKTQILYYFNPVYVHAATTLTILCLAQFAVVLFGSVGYLLTMAGYPQKQLIRLIFAMILNVVLNLFLIPIYGIEGAAIATLFTLCVNSLLGYIFVKKILPIKLFIVV